MKITMAKLILLMFLCSAPAFGQTIRMPTTPCGPGESPAWNSDTNEIVCVDPIRQRISALEGEIRDLKENKTYTDWEVNGLRLWAEIKKLKEEVYEIKRKLDKKQDTIYMPCVHCDASYGGTNCFK